MPMPVIIRPYYVLIPTVYLEFPKGQIALGVLENQEYQDHSIEIEPGSMLILYTDGVTDTVSPDGDYYSTRRLIKLISNTN